MHLIINLLCDLEETLPYVNEETILGLPWWSVVKNSHCNAGDLGSIPGWGTKIPHVLEQLSPYTRAAEHGHSGESPCAATKGLE